MHRRLAIPLVAIALALPGFRTAAAAPKIVAIVACDPHAELKKQLRWFGTLVDRPQLEGVLESSILPPNRKEFAGLDVSRPLGIVVTAAGDVPAVHAYVPVKDLGKLLDALRDVLGPVAEVDGVRRLSPPGGMPLDVVEKDGWAIIGPQGAAAEVADPTELFAGLGKQFTLGVQVFPSRMPEGMRQQLRVALDRAAAMAAAWGQAVDRAVLTTMQDSLGETESLIAGVALDMEGKRVSVETQAQMVPESQAAGMLTDAAQAAVTVASPDTADGQPPAVSVHVAMAVPETMRQAALDGLTAMRAPDGADAGIETATALLREALAAMIEAGGYDAAMSIDSSAIDATGPKPFPAVTVGMRIKDGAAFERKVKQLFAAAGKLPDVRVTFDAGRTAGVNLHTITLDRFGFPGAGKDDDTLDVTLAVAPQYAFVLAGGDVPKRLAAVAGASGKPDAAAKPLGDASLAAGPMLRYVALVVRGRDPFNTEAAGLEAAAEVADAQQSALVQLLAQPLERGMSLRLSVDAGAIRSVATSVKRPAGAAGPGIPATGGPDPIPFAVPVR